MIPTRIKAATRILKKFQELASSECLFPSQFILLKLSIVPARPPGRLDRSLLMANG